MILNSVKESLQNIEKNVELHEGVEQVFQTGDNFSHFFGYYYNSPLNRDNQRLLSHRVNFDGRPVKASDRAKIGFFNVQNSKWFELGETKAFNWQQGSMLQWLPPDYNKRIIYNDRGEDKFVSVIVNIETGEEEVLPFPIYAVHPSGDFALAVNYERLYFCRPGYNYQGIENPKWDEPIPEDDGIYKVGLQTGKVELLVRTRNIVGKGDLSEQVKSRDHWLEHMIWNPSGTRFAFLHRWSRPEGGHRTRLFTADSQGGDIYMFPDKRFYSHMGWRTDKEFTIWTKKGEGVAEQINKNRDALSLLLKLARPVYRYIKEHFLSERVSEKLGEKVGGSSAFLEMWDKSEKSEVLGEGILNRNGHNTWSPKNKDVMLTDTYPDENGYRHLFLYNKSYNKLTELGKFKSPYNEVSYRCDLHPRWSRGGERVIFDSAHSKGKRQIIMIGLNNLIES